MKWSEFIGTDNENQENAPQKPAVLLTSAKSVNDAYKIADDLKTKAVLVKVQADTRMEILNIQQFLKGVCYAIGGKMTKLDENILLCLPASFEFEDETPVLNAEQDKVDTANQSKQNDTKGILLDDIQKQNQENDNDNDEKR